MSCLDASEYFLQCSFNFAKGSFWILLGAIFLLGVAHVARIIYDDCRG